MENNIAKYLLVIMSSFVMMLSAFGQKESLYVGFGTANITTDTSVVMDTLRAKAMIFKQGNVEFALVECDIIAVPNDIIKSLREKASSLTNIPYGNICISATHNHMANSYKDLMVAVPEALLKAQKNLQPVSLLSGVGRQFNVSHNRRNFMKDGSVVFNPMFLNPNIVRPAGPIDPDVSFVIFYDKSDKPVSSLTNFALHLDVAKEYGAVYQKDGSGSRNSVSADYPYWLERNFKKQFGQQFNSMFLTGCCGNINHFDFSKPGPQSGYQTKSKSIGDSLYNSIKKALPAASKEVPNLASSSVIMSVPLQHLSDEDLEWAKTVPASQLSKKSEEMSERPKFLNDVRKRRFLALENYHNQGYKSSVPLDVQVFKLSDETAIVTLPGEMFVEFGLYIKTNSPFKNTLIVEMSNNAIAYIPTKLAFREGEYEVENSRLASGGGEMLANTAIRLLNSLK